MQIDRPKKVKGETIKKRTLGMSGLEVSAVGFGCMNVAWAYGPPIDRNDAVRLIRDDLVNNKEE